MARPKLPETNGFTKTFDIIKIAKVSDFTYKRTRIRATLLKAEIKNIFSYQFLYSLKMSFINKGEIKTFSDKEIW